MASRYRPHVPQAVKLPGDNAYYLQADTPAPTFPYVFGADGAHTMYVAFNTASVSGLSAIFGWGGPTTNTRNTIENNGGTLTVLSTSSRTTSAGSFGANEWHFATYYLENVNNMRSLLLDDKVSSIAEDTGYNHTYNPQDDGGKWRVGNHGDSTPTSPFNGLVCLPAIWAGELTLGERVALGQGAHPLSIAQSRLVACWDLVSGIDLTGTVPRMYRNAGNAIPSAGRAPIRPYAGRRLFILPTGIEPPATSSNQTITLDQVTETGTANDIGTGTQTIPLDQATEAGTAADLTPAPGVVAVTLDQATETGAAADLTAAPGVAAVVLDQATEAGTPDDVTPVAGAAAIPLDQATETGTAADITPDATAVVTLDQATEAGTPADLTPVPGVVAVTLDQATEVGTASDLAALLPGQVALDQVTETGTANDITPVPGAVAITLDQATETGTAADVTPAPGAAITTLDQAAETGTPADLTAVPGAAAVTLDQAAETGTANDITPVQAGAQVIALDQATEAGSVSDLTPTSPSSLTGISTGDEVMRRRGPHWSGQMYADEVYEALEEPRPRREEEPAPSSPAAKAKAPRKPDVKAPTKVATLPAAGGLVDAAPPETQGDELSADDALMLLLLAA